MCARTNPVPRAGFNLKNPAVKTLSHLILVSTVLLLLAACGGDSTLGGGSLDGSPPFATTQPETPITTSLTGGLVLWGKEFSPEWRWVGMVMVRT